MAAVSPEAKARRREYARKAQFLHYHMRRLVLATKEEQELQSAINTAKARSLPRHHIIELYERLDRAQAAIVTHKDALAGRQARTYHRNKDFMFNPELEAFLAEVKDPSLGTRADKDFLEGVMEDDPILAEMIRESMRDDK